MNRATKQILIVEDDQDLRENLAYVLETEGYAVLQAENGQVALELLEHRSPDHLAICVILDLMMPVMDGKSFLQVLLADRPYELAKISIFIATAKYDASQLLSEVPLKLDYIQKPMELSALLTLVEKHCGPP